MNLTPEQIGDMLFEELDGDYSSLRPRAFKYRKKEMQAALKRITERLNRLIREKEQ